MLFSNLMLLLFSLVLADCWSYNIYNPICWIQKCEDQQDLSPWQNVFYSNYNHYCALWGCPKTKNKQEQETMSWKFWNSYSSIRDWSLLKNDPEVSYKSIFNPYCWFYDCHQQKNNFWKNFHGFEHYFLSDKYNPICLIGFCSEQNKQTKDETPETNRPSLWSEFKTSSFSVLRSMKTWSVSVEPKKLSNWKPVCWFKECCNEYYIPGSLTKLKKMLETNIYGQPLINTVVDALNSHWNSPHKPTKALVISFQGWVGSGKTYVANLIAESLFKEGIQSQFFHYFHGRKHFTLEDKTKEYQENLRVWLRSNVSNCPKQLIVFDEVDMMPGTILNSIKPMMDYRASVEDVNYSQTIFLFISNTGSDIILKQFERLIEKKTREEIELKDFERLILSQAFNEKGGLHQFDAISENLIDHYIPFFPLERKHIVSCIEDEFRKLNFKLLLPQDNHILSEIMDSLLWDLGKNNQFSKSGCKSIKHKVAVATNKYKLIQQEKTSDL